MANSLVAAECFLESDGVRFPVIVSGWPGLLREIDAAFYACDRDCGWAPLESDSGGYENTENSCVSVEQKSRKERYVGQWQHDRDRGL